MAIQRDNAVSILNTSGLSLQIREGWQTYRQAHPKIGQVILRSIIGWYLGSTISKIIQTPLTGQPSRRFVQTYLANQIKEESITVWSPSSRRGSPILYASLTLPQSIMENSALRESQGASAQLHELRRLFPPRSKMTISELKSESSARMMNLQRDKVTPSPTCPSNVLQRRRTAKPLTAPDDCSSASARERDSEGHPLVSCELSGVRRVQTSAPPRPG